jgi:catechol 2,3-dioxygenase-like lactoylglutathione lyase family enzyme
MVNSFMGHVQINIDAQNLGFYKDLFRFLNWSVLYEDDAIIGVGDKNGAGLWFVPALKPVENDYDGFGMNHLALAVSKQSEVDEAVAYLQERAVKPLFETPRHRPDFADSAENTYYQVMFESPDRILFEIVYVGPLDK